MFIPKRQCHAHWFCIYAYFYYLYALDEAKGKYIALCEGDDYWCAVYDFLSERGMK